MKPSFAHFCKTLGISWYTRFFAPTRPSDFHHYPVPRIFTRPAGKKAAPHIPGRNQSCNHAGGTNSIFPLNINVPMPGKPLLRATMSCRSMCMNLQRSMISTWLSTPGTMRNFKIVNTNSDFTNRVSHSSLSRVLTSLDRQKLSYIIQYLTGVKH